jgi:hypothetical protein
MNGYNAFKFYSAIKLHFSSPKYDVFTSKGRIRGSYETYLKRNDYYLFEKLARQFSTEREYILFVASNFLYGHPGVVYDVDRSNENYKEFVRRRQSITKIFEDDLQTIVDEAENSSCNLAELVVNLWLGERITIETVSILNDLDSVTDKIRSNTHLALMLGDNLLTIDKAHGFIKYDSYRIMSVYQNFNDDLKDQQ